VISARTSLSATLGATFLALSLTCDRVRSTSNVVRTSPACGGPVHENAIVCLPTSVGNLFVPLSHLADEEIDACHFG
jgi:hypothetical protein